MMSTTVTCDACKRDLTVTGFAAEHYLALIPQAMGHASAAVMSMELGPAIAQPAHFCDLRCLAAWMDGRS